MTDRPETHLKMVAWTRALSLLALVAPAGLTGAAWGLALAGVAYVAAWLFHLIIFSLLVGLLGSGLAVLVASALWLSRAATFRQVLATLVISVLGVGVNLLVVLFIFSQMRY